MFIFIHFKRETENVSKRGAEREKNPKQALRDINTRVQAGLNPTSRKIMT